MLKFIRKLIGLASPGAERPGAERPGPSEGPGERPDPFGADPEAAVPEGAAHGGPAPEEARADQIRPERGGADQGRPDPGPRAVPDAGSKGPVRLAKNLPGKAPSGKAAPEQAPPGKAPGPAMPGKAPPSGAPKPASPPAPAAPQINIAKPPAAAGGGSERSCRPDYPEYPDFPNYSEYPEPPVSWPHPALPEPPRRPRLATRAPLPSSPSAPSGPRPGPPAAPNYPPPAPPTGPPSGPRPGPPPQPNVPPPAGPRPGPPPQPNVPPPAGPRPGPPAPQPAPQPAPPLPPLDPVQRKIFDDIENGAGNLMILGPAGSGKSVLVRHLKANSNRSLCLVSPTGLAAVNIGGSTIHSLFRLPQSEFLEPGRTKLGLKTKSVLNAIDLLVVDEMSMVRPDILDSMDALCREARGRAEPFGGLQVVLVGDPCQLPPVIRGEAEPWFEAGYGHRLAYVFDARSYRRGGFRKVELGVIHRQSDPELLRNLDNVRLARDLGRTLKYFSRAAIGDPRIVDTSVVITPYKRMALDENQRRLAALPGPPRSYAGTIENQFNPATDCQAPEVLTLKVGALVMVLRNLTEDCVNGSLALVASLGDDAIGIELLRGGKSASLNRVFWEKLGLERDPETGRPVERVIGRFRQFPLALGYAMTIHKAQGLTLDSVVVKLDHRGTFTHGQLYTALSRTRTMADLHVSRELTPIDNVIDPRVLAFVRA